MDWARSSFFCVTQLSIFPVPTFVLYCLWWVTVLTLGMDRVPLFHVIVRMDCSVMKQTANSSETEISQETGELSEILSHVTWMRLPNVGSLGVSGISFHSKPQELYSIVFAVSYSVRLSSGDKVPCLLTDPACVISSIRVWTRENREASAFRRAERRAGVCARL